MRRESKEGEGVLLGLAEGVSNESEMGRDGTSFDEKRGAWEFEMQRDGVFAGGDSRLGSPRRHFGEKYAWCSR